MGKIVQEVGTIDRLLNKRSIESLAEQNAREIIDSGQYDLLKVYIELKRYETYLKSLIQELKNPALNKAGETGQNKFDYHHAHVNIGKRTKWDFSVDTTWSEIDHQIKELTARKKEREKILKENKVIETVDEETGELIGEIDLPREIQYLLAIRL
ncbi:MAG TPA: hypothetical protein VKZ54_13480 [Membranihabitans sp.]|nr:hypothetical protein [Membranihabitans sp.]